MSNLGWLWRICWNKLFHWRKLFYFIQNVGRIVTEPILKAQQPISMASQKFFRYWFKTNSFQTLFLTRHPWNFFFKRPVVCYRRIKSKQRAIQKMNWPQERPLSNPFMEFLDLWNNCGLDYWNYAGWLWSYWHSFHISDWFLFRGYFIFYNCWTRDLKFILFGNFFKS